jgi:hypothetical protein
MPYLSYLYRLRRRGHQIRLLKLQSGSYEIDIIRREFQPAGRIHQSSYYKELYYTGGILRTLNKSISAYLTIIYVPTHSAMLTYIMSNYLEALEHLLLAALRDPSGLLQYV